MNALINSNIATMNSREIAELVGSRHDKVKQSIERLAARGVIVQPPLGDEPSVDSMGRPRITEVYVFSGEKGKRDSIVVVAQLSPEFTARLVDRWQELEAKLAQPAFPILSRSPKPCVWLLRWLRRTSVWPWRTSSSPWRTRRWHRRLSSSTTAWLCVSRPWPPSCAPSRD